MVTAAEAAAKAHVDRQAVHAWCRSGRVKAVKGRAGWDIDPESLTAHLDYTEALATAFVRIGGKEWSKADKHRVYLDDEVWQEWSGLVFTRDRGQPLRAFLDGREIFDHDERASTLTWAIKGRIYFDAADHTLVLPGTPELTLQMRAFWADGPRAESQVTIDLAARICAGAAARTGLDFGIPFPIRIGSGSHDFALAVPAAAFPLETS